MPTRTLPVLDLTTAIKTSWDISQLAAACRLFGGRIPERTAFPYILYDIISSVSIYHTNDLDFHRSEIQLRCYESGQFASLALAQKAINLMAHSSYFSSGLPVGSTTKLLKVDDGSVSAEEEDKGIWRSRFSLMIETNSPKLGR